MTMTKYKNIFTCECMPNHVFHSIINFNNHFESIHHKLHECSANTKVFTDYNILQNNLRKMTEDRDQWKNRYYQELFKDKSL